jgi:type II secretory pathway pseudopilin PulG
VKRAKWTSERRGRHEAGCIQHGQDARATGGFTAIEISMVVTVIAILALMILPLFRDRIEAARKAAAQDEMQTLMKAETLALADTGWMYRLQDLDNTTTWNDPPVRADEEVPIASWNHAFTPEERRKLRPGSANAWKGPYISISRFKFMELQDAIASIPEFFWSYPSRGGPTMDLTGTDWWLADMTVPIAWDNPQDKILIDPWGTPYLFFGTGKLMEEGGAYIQVETNFGNAAIYCLGPDGMPGNQVPYQGNATSLLREWGIIGTGDDYYLFF